MSRGEPLNNLTAAPTSALDPQVCLPTSRAGEPPLDALVCPGPPWPPYIVVSHELLAEAPPEFLVSDGQTIQFRRANGQAATYRVTDICGGDVHGQLMTWSGPRA